MPYKLEQYLCTTMEALPNKSYTVEEATKRLMNFCAYRDRSHKEVEDKLREMKMIPAAQEQIIIKLIQDNFLNEERFAQSYARGKFRIKKWGKKRIVQELKFRKISKRNIETALKEIDEKDYIKTFYELAEKKVGTLKEEDLFRKKKKLADYLFSKGYESNLIYDYIADL